jgi:hypothetical protein
MKYRKRPIEVEAMQWDGTNASEIRKWAAEFSPLDSEDATEERDRTGVR